MVNTSPLSSKIVFLARFLRPHFSFLIPHPCSGMKVLKFGGTSVGSPTAIRGLIDILKGYHQRGDRFTVIFSAFSKVTDTLLEMAQKASKGDKVYLDLLENVRSRHLDAIAALLEPDHRAPVEAHILSNFEALGNVLQGIFLLQSL